jgi:Zn ribbon nucleic-acid-binding protein
MTHKAKHLISDLKGKYIYIAWNDITIHVNRIEKCSYNHYRLYGTTIKRNRHINRVECIPQDMVDLWNEKTIDAIEISKEEFNKLYEALERYSQMTKELNRLYQQIISN